MTNPLFVNSVVMKGFDHRLIRLRLADVIMDYYNAELFAAQGVDIMKFQPALC
jgi:hypothetical protein